jgi:hypothetical protein
VDVRRYFAKKATKSKKWVANYNPTFADRDQLKRKEEWLPDRLVDAVSMLIVDFIREENRDHIVTADRQGLRAFDYGGHYCPS